MIRNRFPYFASLAAGILMSAVAVWMIVESPGEIDDAAPYRPPPSPSGEPVNVTVQPGQAPASIADALEQAGVIESDTQFRVLVSLMGYDRLLQAGDYEFLPGTPVLDVIYRIRNGVVATRSVTVIEGWRLEEIADALDAEGIPRDDFLSAAASTDYEYDFLADLPRRATLEGFLYPATYPVRSKDTADTMVRKMLDAFAQNLPPGITEQADARGLTLHEVLTIASIIQREAKLPEEKPIMAQVFLTRLRIGMPLGADPTIQYALADDPDNVDEFGYWKAGLTLDDLQYDSPYNTYTDYGLPPGPICSPAADTILAVVKPSDTDYLYFVAKPDGSHAFAETLDEHMANIEKYQNGAEQ